MVGPTTYGDVIHNSATMHFSFRDRLRILIGRAVTTRTKIYTKQAVDVLHTEAETTVHRTPPKDQRGEGLSESFTHPKK